MHKPKTLLATKYIWFQILCRRFSKKLSETPAKISCLIELICVLASTREIIIRLPSSNSSFSSFFYLWMLLLSHSVMSDSLWPLGWQYARFLCPPLSPRVCSNSCSLNWWCYQTILSFVTPFSFCLQSFPASGPIPMGHLFLLGDQSTRASTLASVLPMNIQGWFPLGLTGMIFLQSKEPSILWHSAFFIVQLSHPYMTTGKITALTIWTFIGKVMSLLFFLI